MANLVAATIFFLASHLGLAATPLRVGLVGRIGEPAYRGLYSLLALAGLVWMVLAYNAADRIVLWDAGSGGRHVAFLLVLVAFYLLVAGLTVPNPTLAGAEGTLDRDDAAQGIVKVTRHPLMWGIGLWALAHLLGNGHLAGLVFFGALGVLALLGSFLLDVRKARAGGEAWARFAAGTSWLPFLALLRRRTGFGLADFGWWRPLLALAFYFVFLLWGHGWLIGVPLVAR